MLLEYAMNRLTLLTYWLLLVLPVSAAGADCKRCETKLDLSEEEWQCLVRKLPALDETKRSLFFLAVSPSACDEEADDNSRASSARLPETNASASTVLRLSRNQIACLVSSLPGISPIDGKVSFEFAAECTTDTAE